MPNADVGLSRNPPVEPPLQQARVSSLELALGLECQLRASLSLQQQSKAPSLVRLTLNTTPAGVKVPPIMHPAPIQASPEEALRPLYPETVAIKKGAPGFGGRLLRNKREGNAGNEEHRRGFYGYSAPFR